MPRDLLTPINETITGRFAAGSDNPERDFATLGEVDRVIENARPKDLLQGIPDQQQFASTGTYTTSGNYEQPSSFAPKVKNPEQGADFGTAALAHFADDVKTRISVYAKDRFPDLPPEQAQSKYGMIDGELVFRGEDGGLYREEPNGVMNTLKYAAAHTLPHAPELVGAGIGAVAGGGFASAGLAALGAAGGEGIRKSAANLLLDEPQTSTGNAIDMAKSGIIAGGLTKAGEVLAGAIGSRAVAGSAKELRKAKPETYTELQRTADQYDIPLTPAELTNLPSLKADQQLVGMRAGDSADTMGNFYAGRAKQVDKSIEAWLNKISRNGSSFDTGVNARTAANDLIKASRAARQQKAKPLYDKVVNDKNLIPDDQFTVIGEDPMLQRALKAAKRDKVLGSTLTNASDSSMLVVDATKKWLDDSIGKASRAGQNNKARVLRDAKSKLIDTADAAFPDYKAARDAFAGNSPKVDELANGVIGKIAKANDATVHKIADPLFDPRNSTVENVLKLKGNLPKDDFNALLRSYIQRRFYLASEKGESAGRFRNAIFGTDPQRKMLKVAMGERDYRSFGQFMKVLEASTRVPKGQSMTAVFQERQKEMARKAVGTIAKGAAATRTMGASVGRWYSDLRQGQYADELARIITSPDAMAKLKQLRGLPVSS